MKVHRKPQPYIYLHCQLDHVAPGLSLLVSVCLFMLPMLVLVDEHTQLRTMYCMNAISQWSNQRHHMTFSHTPLVLPSLNNVLPIMILQNRVVRLNISRQSYTSSYSSASRVLPILHLNLLSSLGKNVARMMVVLLLLLSGDIETNPGPVGEFLCLA